jgi:hypothetical protein
MQMITCPLLKRACCCFIRRSYLLIGDIIVLRLSAELTVGATCMMCGISVTQRSVISEHKFTELIAIAALFAKQQICQRHISSIAGNDDLYPVVYAHFSLLVAGLGQL